MAVCGVFLPTHTNVYGGELADIWNKKSVSQHLYTAGEACLSPTFPFPNLSALTDKY